MGRHSAAPARQDADRDAVVMPPRVPLGPITDPVLLDAIEEALGRSRITPSASSAHAVEWVETPFSGPVRIVSPVPPPPRTARRQALDRELDERLLPDPDPVVVPLAADRDAAPYARSPARTPARTPAPWAPARTPARPPARTPAPWAPAPLAPPASAAPASSAASRSAAARAADDPRPPAAALQPEASEADAPQPVPQPAPQPVGLSGESLLLTLGVGLGLAAVLSVVAVLPI